MAWKWVLENCATATLYIDNTTINFKRGPVDDADETLCNSYFGRIGYVLTESALNAWSNRQTSSTVNLVTENMGLENPENLAWPIFFGTGRISWDIPIIKEKWGYKP